MKTHYKVLMAQMGSELCFGIERIGTFRETMGNEDPVTFDTLTDEQLCELYSNDEGYTYESGDMWTNWYGNGPHLEPDGPVWVSGPDIKQCIRYHFNPIYLPYWGLGKNIKNNVRWDSDYKLFMIKVWDRRDNITYHDIIHNDIIYQDSNPEEYQRLVESYIELASKYLEKVDTSQPQYNKPQYNSCN